MGVRIEAGRSYVTEEGLVYSDATIDGYAADDNWALRNNKGLWCSFNGDGRNAVNPKRNLVAEAPISPEPCRSCGALAPLADGALCKACATGAEALREAEGADSPEIPGSGQTIRERTLEHARAAVMGRPATHGKPEDCFTDVAAFWIDWLHARHGIDVDLSAADVAMMLALLKVARAASNMQFAEHWTDLAGYAACGAEVAGAGE